jgi:hypothetical protein
MQIFDSINESADKAAESSEQYLKATQNYIKLKVFEQLTISLSLLGKILLLGSLFSIGAFFLAISVALALGDLLNNTALGYLVVGAIFFILTYIAYTKRHLISTKIIQTMSTKFFE